MSDARDTTREDQPLAVLPVLSYATPVSARVLRKPLRTRIIREALSDGGIVFTEVFSDGGQAIAAILFSVLPLVALGIRGFWEISPHRDYSLAGALLVLGAWLADLSAVLLLINQMRTRVTVCADKRELRVARTSLVRSRDRQWASDEIRDIRSWPMGEQAKTRKTLCQLLIQPANGVSISLFQQYGEQDLAVVSDSLRAALGLAAAASGDQQAPLPI